MRLGDLRTQWLNCETAFATFQVTPVQKASLETQVRFYRLQPRNHSLSRFQITASIVASGSLFSSHEIAGD